MISRIWPLFLSILWLATDYFSKVAAVKHLTQQSIEVLSFLNWTLAYNPGAAFSLLSDASGWQRWLFSILAILVTLWLIYAILFEKNNFLMKLGYASVLGGALGNLYDRLQHGYVIDFIHVHYQDKHFPIFNIADTAITLGVIAMIAAMLFAKKLK